MRPTAGQVPCFDICWTPTTLYSLWMSSSPASTTPLGARRTGQSIRHFTTYNRTDAAHRVQDILTSLAHLSPSNDGHDVDLIGIGDAGLWCLLARAVAPISIRLVVDAARFLHR